jgi:hypothetical protein
MERVSLARRPGSASAERPLRTRARKTRGIESRPQAAPSASAAGMGEPQLGTWRRGVQMMAGRALGLVLVSMVAVGWLVAGCGGGTEAPPTDLSFTGGIERGQDSLGFDLPAMESAGAAALQAESEELLGSITLEGDEAPEVGAHGTARQQIRFSVVGMGAFVATRWHVAIVKQGSSHPDDAQEQDASLAGRDHANVAFTGLSVGRWDTTLALYGVRRGAKGNLLFSLVPPTTIDVTPTLLSFDAATTTLTLHVVATTPDGADPVEWTATTPMSWLSLSPESGSGSGDIAVTVDRTGLAAGLYNDGLITLSTAAGSTTADVAMEVPPPQPKILFISTRTGSSEVWAVSADGSGLEQITHDGVYACFPRWSPDYSRIAWTSSRYGGHQICTMDPDGSDVALVPTGLEISNAGGWSPDGQTLVLEGITSGQRDVYTVGLDGAGLQPIAASPEAENGPCWSPDGEFIVYTRNNAVWRVAPDGSGAQLLRSTCGGPAVSPDGTRIVYSVWLNGIWTMNVDGGDVRQLTSGDDGNPSWSPDGTRIAFSSTRAGNYEIYVMTADGDELTRITSDPAEDNSPRWASP